MNKPEEALKSLNKLIARNKADDTGYLNRASFMKALANTRKQFQTIPYLLIWRLPRLLSKKGQRFTIR